MRGGRDTGHLESMGDDCVVSYPIPETGPADPPIETIEVVAGIYFRGILLEKAELVVPQHEHDHDHATYIGSGRVRFWCGGEWQGDFDAGKVLEVKAGFKHTFMSLAPMTRLTCVWPEAIGATFPDPAA